MDRYLKGNDAFRGPSRFGFESRGDGLEDRPVTRSTTARNTGKNLEEEASKTSSFNHCEVSNFTCLPSVGEGELGQGTRARNGSLVNFHPTRYIAASDDEGQTSRTNPPELDQPKFTTVAPNVEG